MFKEISNKIKSLLDEDALAEEIYEYEEGQFKGFPAITITPSNNESDYHTTNENERIYAFNVRCYIPRNKGDEKMA